ncbi:MAG: tRNA 2-selenouridine(34) synthase MnmH [Saprospiraceae bacterium]
MSVKRINDHFELTFDLIIDVRSPGEYNHAHIPGAKNLPLFSDEERAVVGTLYKQKSKEDAIKAGLGFYGPKMQDMISTVESWLNEKKPIDAAEKFIPGRYTLLVHCWRGGMRSGGVAWLLDLYGFDVYVLEGGYKAYRNRVLACFEKPWPFFVLAGNTGAGKTKVLHELEKRGEAVIDLEGIAHHKGSAFGNIGMPEQPGQEMFENLLANELYIRRNQPIWIEDESIRIGHVNLPKSLWVWMGKCHHFMLDIPFEKRLEYTVAEYGKLPVEKMVNAIIRIKKRLGGLETKNAINALIEGQVHESFAILLKYYDKWYDKAVVEKSLSHDLLTVVPCEDTDPKRNAESLLSIIQK